MTETEKTAPDVLGPDIPDGPIPETAPALAEIQPTPAGQFPLDVSLSLDEIGCIAASLQLCVHVHAISTPSQLNVANSVLRKFHDAKQRYVSANSDK